MHKKETYKSKVQTFMFLAATDIRWFEQLATLILLSTTTHPVTDIFSGCNDLQIYGLVNHQIHWYTFSL